MSKKINDFLSQYHEEVSPIEFYRDLFPKNDFQKKGEFEKNKYNAIIVELEDKGDKKKVLRHTVTDDLDKINEVIERDNFCLMSPIGYIGKTRESKNARTLYALTIDLDGLIETDKYPIYGLNAVFYQIEKLERLPKPTYIVSSGSGIHLYYVLEKPILLYPNVVKQLQKFKKYLTWKVWFDDITTLHDKIQYESLFQGFRVVGTITKKGERARAYRVGDKVDMDYLNQFVEEDCQVKNIAYKSDLTLAQAKDKYPEWYQKRIVNKQPKGTWTNKRALYDWWKQKIKEKAEVGHRYYCLMCLSIYARKCNITKKELEKDAFEIAVDFANMKAEIDNPFTEKDILASLEAYNDNYITYPRSSIEYVSGIRIDKNKRNGRKRDKHLMGARAIRDINNPNWRKGNGRKNKEIQIQEWKKNNPNKKKIDCHKETKISRTTIDKWW